MGTRIPATRPKCRIRAALLLAFFPVAIYVVVSMLDVDGFSAAVWPVDDMTFAEARQAETLHFYGETLAPPDSPMILAVRDRPEFEISKPWPVTLLPGLRQARLRRSPFREPLPPTSSADPV